MAVRTTTGTLIKKKKKSRGRQIYGAPHTLPMCTATRLPRRHHHIASCGRCSAFSHHIAPCPLCLRLISSPITQIMGLTSTMWEQDLDSLGLKLKTDVSNIDACIYLHVWFRGFLVIFFVHLHMVQNVLQVYKSVGVNQVQGWQGNSRASSINRRHACVCCCGGSRWLQVCTNSERP